MTNETIDAVDVKALESDRDTHLAEVIRLRQQNAELVRVLQWWQAQIGDDACDDMGKLLDTMTGKVSAILAKVQS